MNTPPSRRDLFAAAACLPFVSRAAAQDSPQPVPLSEDPGPPFRISLAQWSLHRTIRGGELDALDFPRHAREVYGIDAVEYVNQFFADKACDFEYLTELKKRADDAQVRSLLIMVDGEGALAASDDAERRRAIEAHYKWVVAARLLGCHSIRVNAAGDGEREQRMQLAADSLTTLADYAGQYEINVIVENHGGLSSDGSWLAGVMKLANHERVGTLPDFGNFQIQAGEWYDRYLGTQELMPFAKAVSAKSHAFDAEGNETNTDYRRMLKIVLDADYSGYVGIEYEGSDHSEHDGIQATKALLERVRDEITRDTSR